MLRTILKRWPLKLLAIAIAFAIWLAIVGENQIIKDFTVTLDFDLSEETILTGSRPTQVTVRLRGPESIIRRIDAFDLAAEIDLSNESPGDISVDLHPTDVTGVPPNAIVELIDPNRIDLTITRRLKRLLEVVPTIVGQPAEGFTFYGVKVNPETLEVSGPESIVSALDHLRTAAISIQGASTSFSVTTDAVPASAEVRILNSTDLEARIEIDENPVEVTFEEVPVVLNGQEYEVLILPPTTIVTLSGPPTLLARIDPARLSCIADVTGLEPRREPYRLPARLTFPDLPARDLTRITEKYAERREITVRVLDRRKTE